MYDWVLPASISGIARTFAYRRAALRISTAVSIALLAAYSQCGTPPPWRTLRLPVAVFLLMLSGEVIMTARTAERLA